MPYKPSARGGPATECVSQQHGHPRLMPHTCVSGDHGLVRLGLEIISRRSRYHHDDGDSMPTESIRIPASPAHFCRSLAINYVDPDSLIVGFVLHSSTVRN